jgi:hypothetical protein
VKVGELLLALELLLEHRATGRDLRGFLHRARQLSDIARAYMSRGGQNAKLRGR